MHNQFNFRAFGPCRRFSRCALVLFFLTLAGCGTTYELPEISKATSARASEIFAEERQIADRGGIPNKSPKAAVSQYLRVVKRVEPVAETFCRTQTAERDAFNCDVQIFVDDKLLERNAYQTYTPDGDPFIAFTIPLIADARNEHEIAFVLGHEFGHHIAEHIQKQKQQALAGALVMGVLTAYGQSASYQYNASYNSYNAQKEMERNMQVGAQIGQTAFSQSYELEADVIGAHIAAAAGYDPIIGARYFARPEAARSEAGRLSFWGTHPPDEKRVATVIATVEIIKSSQALAAR